MVISQVKNHSHPQFGIPSVNGYTIDGVQGKEMTLIRGITYYFSVLAPGHPFFISTSIVGGPGNLGSEVTDGVTGSMTTNGTLSFTPNSNHPNLLYYQCANHNNMGWKINIVDQLPDGDLGSCMSGNYSLFVTDANGCSNSSPVNVFIAEPAANTFYYDGDNDMYGKHDESALSCTAPPGFVTNYGDCNDADPAINPGQTELCNGFDDNCDATVDEGCSLTLNLKVFIEGYYSGNNTMQPTMLNAGETTDSTLCDTIMVELHEDVSPYGILNSKTVLLYIDGNATAQFSPSFVGSAVYIVVRMRNSIETWSKLPVLLSTTTIYDFTTPE